METSGQIAKSLADIILGKLNFSDYNLNVAQVKYLEVSYWLPKIAIMV